MRTKTMKKSVGAFMFAGLMIAGSFTASVYAQTPTTLSGGFSFGPGTPQTSSDARTLNVPARTTVAVVVQLQRSQITANKVRFDDDVNVTIEVFQPNGTRVASASAAATVATSLIPSISIPSIFSSQTGCPSTWRVRVRTENNQAPPVRVFGTITFAFLVPGTTNLDMEGDPVGISGGQTKAIALAGHNLTGGSDPSLVAGTGEFKIKAKWHTDPLDLIHFNQFFRLTVALVKPNGTVATSQTRFSQHSPDPFTPRIDLTYTATAQDAAMTGPWKIRITSPGTNPNIVNFDIERGLDINSPSFNSTFLAKCSSAISVN